MLQAIDTIFSGSRWVSAQVTAYLLNRLLKRNNRLSATLLVGNVSSLSSRELVVLEIKAAPMIGKGGTAKETAGDLSLSPRTVDIHRANIKKKLPLKSRAEVVAFAIART